MGGIPCVHRGAGAAPGRARRRTDAADHRRRRRARAVGGRTRPGLAPRPATGRVEAGLRAGVVDRVRSRKLVRRQPFARQRANRWVARQTGAAGGVNCWVANYRHRPSHKDTGRGMAARRKSHLILLIRFKSASIRDCQPLPPDLYFSSTEPDRRIVTGFFVGALFGPRPLRNEAAREGKGSAKRFALAKSFLVHSGLSLTSRKSRTLKRFFLIFRIEFPFISAGRPHAENADRLFAQGDKHHNNYAADILADAAPALVVRGQNQSAVEESLVEISEIQAVLFDVG